MDPEIEGDKVRSSTVDEPCRSPFPVYSEVHAPLTAYLSLQLKALEQIGAANCLRRSVNSFRRIRACEYADRYELEYNHIRPRGSGSVTVSTFPVPLCDGDGSSSIVKVRGCVYEAIGVIMNAVVEDRNCGFDIRQYDRISDDVFAWFEASYHYRAIQAIRDVAPRASLPEDLAVLERAAALGFEIPK